MCAVVPARVQVLNDALVPSPLPRFSSPTYASAPVGNDMHPAYVQGNGRAGARSQRQPNERAADRKHAALQR